MMNADVDVVVIGGAGFIGTRLCEELDRLGVSFAIIDKRRSEAFPGKSRVADVRDLGALRAAMLRCRWIINLAAEHRDDVWPVELYREVNVNGARNVCEVATEFGVEKMVFTSSVACYGYASAMASEGSELRPFNEYGRTKMQAEGVYDAWQQADPVRRVLLIVRPTVVFGERNRGNVFNLLNAIAKRQFIMIGAGRNVKSMAYVGNLVAFIVFMMSQARGRVVTNYVDEPQLEVRELVALARRALRIKTGSWVQLPGWLGLAIGRVADLSARLLGRTFPISEVRVKKFMATSSYSSSARSLGFVPPSSLEEALIRTIEFEFLSGRVSGPTFDSE